MFLLIFSSLILADNTVNQGVVVTGEIDVILGIIFASVFVIIALIIIAYFTFQFVKRKMSEPQYYIDDTSSNKDSSGFPNGNNNIYDQDPHIHQIQPILTVSQVISSIKQSLEDLGNALIPFSWSRAQNIYNQQSPVNEKKDLPI